MSIKSNLEDSDDGILHFVHRLVFKLVHISETEQGPVIDISCFYWTQVSRHLPIFSQIHFLKHSGLLGIPDSGLSSETQ